MLNSTVLPLFKQKMTVNVTKQYFLGDVQFSISYLTNWTVLKTDTKCIITDLF